MNLLDSGGGAASDALSSTAGHDHDSNKGKQPKVTLERIDRAAHIKQQRHLHLTRIEDFVERRLCM